MNWIKKMEGDNLEIADFKDPNHLKRIEMGITYGKKVLFLDVGEEIDPTLDNVLNKNLISAGGRSLAVKIGDKEVEYNPNFKLYITTRMSNPHYTPEVSTKVTVVNFQVKEDGLEEQCLGIVVLAEQPTVEQNRGEQIMKIEQNNAKIIELEDNILQLLQDADPDLILENVVLIDTLQDSKETQIEVKETLQQAQIAMRKINDMREQYRPCGKEAAILFFVLNDLNKINTMYQFSLDWYKKLFLRSINESGGEFGGGSNGSKERCEEITKKHMQNVYDTVCRSLFERHKILLSMQMCIKRQMSGDTPPDMNEWNFFLKGGEVLDRAAQPPKPPFDWITQQAWDNLTELSQLSENFKGIDQAVSLSVKDWHRWYQFPDPEVRNLPGEW
jgi:dynein heavy chain